MHQNFEVQGDFFNWPTPKKLFVYLNFNLKIKVSKT